MKYSVIVTIQEARMASMLSKEKVDPFAILADKFKKEYGLEFTTEEVKDQSRFKYELSVGGDAHKITYEDGKY